MDHLDQLFEHYQVSATAEEKAELSRMYQDFLNELCYDFSCGKLTDEGVELMLPIVEKIEFLDGCISWELRAQTYSVLMEQAEETGDELAVISNGELAVVAYLNRLETTTQEKSLIYHGLANVHYTLARYALKEQTAHWKKSLQYIKSAIIEQPQDANWTRYLELVFGKLQQETRELIACRNEEQKTFRNWCLVLEKKEGALAFKIASQWIRFNAFTNDSTQDEFLFPETEYLFWLEKSLEEDMPELLGHEISSLGHFYKKEGLRLQRVDVLQKALSYYKRMIEDDQPGNGFAVYYVTDALESIAQVYLKAGNPRTADEYMAEALHWNEDYQEHIGSNFSLQLHYAEFLERCYSYEGAISKPSLSFIVEMTKRAEQMGEGYYSGPYFIQARLALKEKQEHKAVAFIARSLLLHELNIQELVEEFKNNLPKDTFTYLKKFLLENLQFMKEVTANYYFSPKVSFAALSNMTDDEIMGAWILRKAEIKNRNKLIPE